MRVEATMNVIQSKDPVIQRFMIYYECVVPDLLSVTYAHELLQHIQDSYLHPLTATVSQGLDEELVGPVDDQIEEDYIFDVS